MRYRACHDEPHILQMDSLVRGAHIVAAPERWRQTRGDRTSGLCSSGGTVTPFDEPNLLPPTPGRMIRVRAGAYRVAETTGVALMTRVIGYHEVGGS